MRARSIVSALAALLWAGAAPVAAQVVIGGSGGPDVQVNWSVIDRLGPAPTLPSLLGGKLSPAVAAAAEVPPGQIIYHRYGHSHAKADKPRFTPYHAGHSHRAAHHAAGHHVSNRHAKAAHPAEVKVPEHRSAVPAPRPAETTPVARTAAVAPAAPVKSVPAVAAKVAAAVPAPATPSATPATPSDTPAPDAAPLPVSAGSAPAPAASPAPAAPATPAPAAPAPAPVVASATAPGTAPSTSTLAAPMPPPAAPKPAEAKAEQAAALPAAVDGAGAAVIHKGDVLSVVFPADSADVPDGARPDLKALARRMDKDEGLTLQLLSYAHADSSDFGKARRMSLSRALEVRRALMEQGVRSTRIDVRALGAKQGGNGPADRVDAVLVSAR